MGAARRYGSVQKLCTLRAHDNTAIKEDVVFHPSCFAELGVKPGDLIAVVAVKESKHQAADKRSQAHEEQKLGEVNDEDRWLGRRAGIPPTIYDEAGRQITAIKELDKSRTYVFLVPEVSAQNKRHQDVALSISSTIANVFGFKNRMQVLVSLADEAIHAASHVEITFRDQYLSRADMWRMAVAELSQKTVHKDQKLVFLDTIKATVKTIYHNGEKRKAGFFGASTKTIFRSESARYIIFIQMSLEMWQFDVEGGGEIMFNKVINGFLPELFKNWASIRARHRISFILFSRVEYDDSDSQTMPEVGLEQGERIGTRDFYRVVITDVSSGDWISILQQLKQEFRTFLRDITLQKSTDVESISHELPLGSDIDPDYMIVGKPTIASKGNILEAINLALVQFSEDHVDRDLLRTGISVMIITAGSGVYEVDYTLLKHTTETLIGSGIGIDLVCLAPMPLHSVPLFKYRNPRLLERLSPLHHTNSSSMDNTPRPHPIASSLTNDKLSSLERTNSMVSGIESDIIPGDWSYAVPHWVDVSFWKGPIDEVSPDWHHVDSLVRKHRRARPAASKGFALRCVLYELEMMGFMENEMTNIAIALMHEHPTHPWQKLRHRITGRPKDEIDRPGIRKIDEDWMDEYDNDVFKAADTLHAHHDTARRLFKAGLADRNAAARPGIGSDSQLAKTMSRTPTGSFVADLKPLTTLASRQGATRRAPSIMSLTSNTDKDSVISRSSVLTRQISYGTSTLAAPQESKVEGKAEASLAKFVVTGKETKKESATPNYFDAFRAMFAKPVPPEIKARREQSPDKDGTDSYSESKDESSPSKQPSEPINISASVKARPKHHSHTSSVEERIGSADTVKANTLSSQKHSLSKSSRVDDGGAILYVASNTRRGSKKPGLLPNGEHKRLTHDPSPLRGIAPWLILVNPSNPLKNSSNLDNRFRRWHHIFPRPLKLSVMKWKSLSSPASVPLTNDFFPSAQELADEYHESTYSIIQNLDDDTLDEDSPKDTRESLLRKLIAFRLAKGFQLIVGAALSDFLGTLGIDHANIFDRSYMTANGSSVFMSMGNTIHQLLSLNPGEVEVRRFKRKPATDYVAIGGSDPLKYKPYIRPALSSTYEPRTIRLSKQGSEYNWNYIDSFLADDHDRQLSENMRFWRARFIFIPVEIPGNHRRPLPMLTEDSEEEIRLEGIRKLTQIWQRNHVQNPEERGFSSSRKRQDRNPLMIDYQTRDPSAVVAAGSSGLLLADGEDSGFIFSETERYSTKNIDLQKLSQDLQSEKGITMIDRRWHWKLYQNCFVAFDLVTWLLDRFRDIPTREEAVELGKELMGKGLFQHVSKKHDFRDGNFFFHISAEYRIPRGDVKGWFGSRRGQTSVPSTPNPDTFRANHLAETARNRPPTSSSSETSLDEKSSRGKDMPRRKVILSHSMKYNVDPRKQSFRPEIINLHYDRLHSPDNCYHFRIDWMNTTAKFIEDQVNLWAMHGRKYGLKLVEIPIGEAAAISENLPFRGPFVVKLAVQPPATQPRELHDAIFLPLRDASTDIFAYHKAILRKLDFVLDVEAASSFPNDVDVVHSWGRNDYQMTQYVHRSGTTVAQITENGEFQLLANRLFNNRSFVTREPSKVDRKDIFDMRSSAKRSAASPSASPSLRPVPESHHDVDRALVTAEEVKVLVEAFCSNAVLLKAFYEEVRKPITSASPATNSTILDIPVPSLRLPPRTAKDTSSSPVLTSLS